MNILFCGDANIQKGIWICILSLMKHISEEIHVYIMTVSFEINGRKYEAVSKEFADELSVLLKKHNECDSVHLFDVSKEFLAELPVANIDTRFTPCCMLRLYADLIPEIPEKILYLDNDIICRKSELIDFYNISMDNTEFAGVLDFYGSWFYRRYIYKRDYINSGVLLLNMKKIKETGLFKKCRTVCAEKEMLLPDQAPLNKLSVAKKRVSRKYNEQRHVTKKTVVQHFTTTFRILPWFHTVSVKPWDIERVHSVLKVHEYDDLLKEYELTYMNKGIN